MGRERFDSGESVWVVHDTAFEGPDVFTNAIGIREIVSELDRMDVETRVLLIDTCYASAGLARAP